MNDRGVVGDVVWWVDSMLSECEWGQWKNDAETGQGTYWFPNGDKYVGDFKDGKKEGEGEMTWPSGNRYQFSDAVSV